MDGVVGVTRDDLLVVGDSDETTVDTEVIEQGAEAETRRDLARLAVEGNGRLRRGDQTPLGRLGAGERRAAVGPGFLEGGGQGFGGGLGVIGLGDGGDDGHTVGTGLDDVLDVIDGDAADG